VSALAKGDRYHHKDLRAADCVGALAGEAQCSSEDLATAVEAAAHGHAMLLLDGAFGEGDQAVAVAAERAAAATLALVEGRRSFAGTPEMSWG
jgi:hypothetical protein